MDRTTYMIEIYCLSGVIGIISKLFGTVEASYIILLVLVIIDTITGMAVAVKYKRFSSRGFSKLIKKVITYTTSIITVRLLEMGIISLVETTMMSRIMLAFLQITEAISTLENLTLLGVPIPAAFMSFVLGHLKIPGLDKILKKEMNNHKSIAEIEEIIKYQITAFDDSYIKKLLELYFETWKDITMQIDNIMNATRETNKEMLYYKILALIELEFKEMRRQWKEEKIPEDYIQHFNMCHEAKIHHLIQRIQYICFSEESIENKKQQIVDTIITDLYKTILDGHKCSTNISRRAR